MPQPGPDTPVRVLLWSPKGSGTHYYGPGSFFYRMYSRADPGRFEITLAHTQPQQHRHELFIDQHRIDPNPYAPSSSIGRYIALRRYCRSARAFLDRHAGAFDIFHGLSAYHWTTEPAWEAHRRGLPAVVFLATSQSELRDKSGLRALLGLPRKRRRMLMELEAIVVMSTAVYDEALRYGFDPSKIARIPMGIDMDRFRPASDDHERAALRRELGWPDTFTLIFVGGHTRNKRPHLLIDAVAMLRDRRHDCRLVLVGPEQDPAYAAEMRALIADHGIEDHVHFHGFTDDVAPLLRAADVFCLPSTSEGMPASVTEAMASGLPALGTAISGITDLIEHEQTGFLIEPDPASIADALRRYITDESLRAAHGAAGRQRILRHFSTSVVLDAYERLFRRVMAGQPPADDV